MRTRYTTRYNSSSLPIQQFCVIAMFIATNAPAQTAHKCLDEAGHVTYQSDPCPAGQSSADISTTQNTFAAQPKLTEKALPSEARAAKRSLRQDSDPVNERAARERKFITTGMSQAEVIARIGAANGKSKHRNSKKHGTETWVYPPSPGDESTLTQITFQDGHVSQVERRIIR